MLPAGADFRGTTLICLSNLIETDKAFRRQVEEIEKKVLAH